jgi:hypothetical protein
MGMKLGLSHEGKRNRLGLFKSRVLRRIIWALGGGSNRRLERIYELHALKLYPSTQIIRIMKSGMINGRNM